MWTVTRQFGPVAIELVGPKGYIHGWIKVGMDVTHKDSSRGRVTHYDPATQTAHVDWHAGPRAARNGGKGTTKAYHLVQGQTGSQVFNAKTVGAKVEQLKKENPGKTAFGGPTKPPATHARKHDWVKPGIAVQHKDGSRGSVRSYDPNTQTMHVDWTTGKRAGTSGTTKAYHTQRVTPSGHPSEPPRPKAGGAGPAARAKLTGKEKALAGTKLAPTKPRASAEVKRPTDPFANIKNDAPVHHTEQERVAAKVQAMGLPPITGKETHDQLVRKLTSHYTAALASKDEESIHTLLAHHHHSGVPTVIMDTSTKRGVANVSPRHHALVAALVAQEHKIAPSPRGVPLVHVRDTSTDVGSNDMARSGGVAMSYNRRKHVITVGSNTLNNPKNHVPASGARRGFFTPTGGASFIERAISHEYGHSLAMNLGWTRERPLLEQISHAIPGATPYNGGDNTRLPDDHTKWMEQNKAAIINQASTYGSASKDELLAELYAEYRHAGHPSEAAKIAAKHLTGGA